MSAHCLVYGNYSPHKGCHCVVCENSRNIGCVWRRKNKKQQRIKRKRYYEKNKTEINRKDKLRSPQRNIMWKYRLEAMFIYALDTLSPKHVCIRCGESDLRCLHCDHIHGNGIKDINKGMKSMKLYMWILSNPQKAKKKYQILCSNCNWRKKYENREL